MTTPDKTIYWEDFEVGRTVPLGEKQVSAEEIIAFGKEFDPQPMHTDEREAFKSMLGGLVASGWHSNVLLMRMICDAYLLNSSSLGSPGIDEIKFVAPVWPGDTLRGQYTCIESRPSGSRAGVGIVKILYELFNQDDELVLIWRCNQFFGTRAEARARQ